MRDQYGFGAPPTMGRPQRGDYMQYWFDTGALGVDLLLGVVIEAGPKACRIRWESGATNRIRYDEPRGVRPLQDIDCLDKHALERLHG